MEKEKDIHETEQAIHELQDGELWDKNLSTSQLVESPRKNGTNKNKKKKKIQKVHNYTRKHPGHSGHLRLRVPRGID